MLKNLSLIFICLALASCGGPGTISWIAKQPQGEVNNYIQNRIDAGRYDLAGVCDRVREIEFELAEDPSDLDLAAAARKARAAHGAILRKKGLDQNCLEPSSSEKAAHIANENRKQAQFRAAMQGLSSAVKSTTDAYTKSINNQSNYNADNRIRELERDKMNRELNCSNSAWRKGLC